MLLVSMCMIPSKKDRHDYYSICHHTIIYDLVEFIVLSLRGLQDLKLSSANYNQTIQVLKKDI